MAKLTDEERAQLEALQAKHDAPDEPEGDDDQGDGDDGHVIVLRGSRADSFLSELLGTGKAKTGKSSTAAPAGTGSNGKSSRQRPPAKAAPGKAADPAEGDDDDDPEGDGQQDTPPSRVNRYFR